MVFWPIFDPKIGFLRLYPGKLRVITSKPLLIDSTVKNTSRKVYLESLAYRAENARKSFYYVLYQDARRVRLVDGLIFETNILRVSPVKDNLAGFGKVRHIFPGH